MGVEVIVGLLVAAFFALIGLIVWAFRKGGKGKSDEIQKEQLEAGAKIQDEAGKHLNKPTTGVVANLLARWNARRSRQLPDSGPDDQA